MPPPAYSVLDLLNAPFLLYMKASGNVYVSKGSKDVFEAPGCQLDEPGAPEGACQPANRSGKTSSRNTILCVENTPVTRLFRPLSTRDWIFFIPLKLEREEAGKNIV